MVRSQSRSCIQTRDQTRILALAGGLLFTVPPGKCRGVFLKAAPGHSGWRWLWSGGPQSYMLLVSLLVLEREKDGDSETEGEPQAAKHASWDLCQQVPGFWKSSC